MSFADFPEVDPSSKYSERSELAMRSVLSQEAGFICRPDIPDKGCDFLVELIAGGQHVTNRRFCVQLKSIEKPRIIKDGTFIAYPLETSRLRYLMQFQPAMGLMILYSVEDDTCYYEYADRIYTRIMEEKGSTDWQAQAGITLHIPCAKQLNTAAARAIHAVFHQRFERAAQMQRSFGQKYGLPTFDTKGQPAYDFNNPHDLKRFLTEYGVTLIDHYDLDMVYTMIAQIPHLEITQGKDLLYIAAIAYAESGRCVDSQFFCAKLRRFTLTADEKEMIDFLDAKNKLSLGYITALEYEQVLEGLEQATMNDVDKVVFQLNIIYGQLLRVRALAGDLPAIQTRIDSLFQAINALAINERRKGLFMVWNARNLAYLTIKYAINYLGEQEMRLQAGYKPGPSGHMKYVEHLSELENRMRNILATLSEQATKQDDLYLKGHILTLEVETFIHKNIQYISFDLPVPDSTPRFEQDLHSFLSFAQTACNFFLRLKMFRDALSNMYQMLELVELAERSFGVSLNVDKAAMYEKKAKMEQELDLPAKDIVFATLVKPAPGAREAFDRANKRLCALMTDEQIRRTAEIQLSVRGLPAENGVHIEGMFKGLRLFYQRCTDDAYDIEVYGDGTTDPKRLFMGPVRFIVRNSAGKVVSGPSGEVEDLLKGIGY